MQRHSLALLQARRLSCPPQFEVRLVTTAFEWKPAPTQSPFLSQPERQYGLASYSRPWPEELVQRTIADSPPRVHEKLRRLGFFPLLQTEFDLGVLGPPHCWARLSVSHLS